MSSSERSGPVVTGQQVYEAHRAVRGAGWPWDSIGTQNRQDWDAIAQRVRAAAGSPVGPANDAANDAPSPSVSCHTGPPVGPGPEDGVCVPREQAGWEALWSALYEGQPLHAAWQRAMLAMGTPAVSPVERTEGDETAATRSSTVDLLREALEFYAEDANYDEHGVVAQRVTLTPPGWPEEQVEAEDVPDRGARANAALDGKAFDVREWLDSVDIEGHPREEPPVGGSSESEADDA